MNVHPTAVIHPRAWLASTVTIGPYCVIGENVALGDDCELMSHGVIDGHTQVGSGNRFFPFVSIGCAPQDLKYRGELTRVEIGSDNVFREFVTVHRGTAGGGGVTRIGNRNLLMAYVHVAHDCTLGDDVIMANGATLSGHVEVQDKAIIGAFSAIHQFCRVGAHAFLGGYSVVTRDLLPYSKTSAPRPLGVYGANHLGLERRGFSKEEIAELQAAFRLLCRAKLNTTQALAAIEARHFQSEQVRALVDFIKSSKRGVVK